MILQLPETNRNSALETEVDRFVQDNIHLLCHIKRFNERWQGDQTFRKELMNDTENTLRNYNLKITIDDIKYFLEPDLLRRNQEEDDLSLTPALKCTLDLYSVMEKASKTPMQVLEDFMDVALKDPRYRAWRKRQVLRLKSQTLRSGFRDTGHYPCAFELSKGCSVGCWFCSLSASSLENVFLYNEANIKLWRELLQLLKDKLGKAVLDSFCYCATDPLDNPDYEKFALDFYKILGTFPQTTTAQAWKYPQRVRSLIKLAEEKGGNVRFSILSRKMLNQIHEQFTAEELANTELILQLEGSLTGTKSNAGRARERIQKKPSLENKVSDDSTPSCVSGFVFNMVTKNIQLMSPCLPNERWIHGHRIHGEATFSDIDDVANILESMIAKHMPLEVSPDDLIRFRQDLHYQSVANGFQLSTKFKKYKFNKSSHLMYLGEIIHQENKTAREIANLLTRLYGVSSGQTFRDLNRLFEQGFLDDGL